MILLGGVVADSSHTEVGEVDLSVPLSMVWAYLKPQLVEVVVAEEQEVAL